MSSRRRFVLWSSILIASLVASGLCQRWLAVRGISYAESLLTRGVSCLVLVLAFAAWRGMPLRPKAPGTQAVRALVAGLALTLFTMSYNWLTASAVSVLSNIDVPLLVVLGPVVGVPASRRVRALALISISCLVWYVSGLEAQPGLLFGLTVLAAGSFLLCFGYLFIRKSMSEENEAVTILVPSLAILVYGALEWKGLSGAWTPGLAAAALISGAAMFAAYRATMRLYELTDLASAEFPTLLSAVAIQPLEALALAAPLRASYLLSSIGFVAAMYVLLRWRSSEAAHA